MGDFDFDSDEPPAGGREGRSSSRSGYRAAPRRAAGRVSLSIGAFVTIGAGLLALVSLLLPAGEGAAVSELVFSRRVWIWALGAIVVGGASVRVRRIGSPTVGDFLLTGFAVLFGFVFALFLALCGYVIIDETGLKGIGTIALCLSGALVALGTVGRCIEQVLRWGKTDGGDEKDEPRPRVKRPSREEDEEDEPQPKARPKAKKPAPEEDEDDEPPKPKAKQPARDEGNKPRPAPKPPAKPAEPPAKPVERVERKEVPEPPPKPRPKFGEAAKPKPKPKPGPQDLPDE